MTKVDNCQVKASAIGQLCSETMPDAKSRFSPALAGAEIICPQPLRATRVPCVFDGLNKFSPKTKSSYCPRNGNYGLEFWDFILSKDELEVDSNNQFGFFCGSPPVRTNNPLINDAEFAKLNQLAASPLLNCHGIIPAMNDKGSSSRGSSPKIRVEGFTCGSPESPRVVSALA